MVGRGGSQWSCGTPLPKGPREKGFCWLLLYTVSRYAVRHCQENRNERGKSYLLQDGFVIFRYDTFPGESMYVDTHKNRWLLLILSIGGCWQTSVSVTNGAWRCWGTHFFFDDNHQSFLHSLEMNIIDLGCRPGARSADQKTRAILPWKLSACLKGTTGSSAGLCKVPHTSTSPWSWLFSLSREDKMPPGCSLCLWPHKSIYGIAVTMLYPTQKCFHVV